jgi:hypothetical protein
MEAAPFPPPSCRTSPLKPANTPSREYRLNCGQYVYYIDGKPTTPPQDEIALAFSATDGTLHKHGKAEGVSQWLAKSRHALLSEVTSKSAAERATCEEMSRDLVMLQGRFLLEDLNSCLTVSGYVARLYAKAKAGTLGSLDRFGNPVKSSAPATTSA